MNLSEGQVQYKLVAADRVRDIASTVEKLHRDESIVRLDGHVSVRHSEDGMSDMYARLPSHEAAAIADRLRTEARKPVAEGDDRTVAQREADLLVAWCTDSDAVKTAISANIAVTIGADVLAGTQPEASEASQAAWCELQRAAGMSGEERAAAA